jgi:hypothetical protein
MSVKEYRQDRAVNFSSLKHILKSPAHYKAALAQPAKETPAMILGTLAHSIILERKEIHQVAAIKPEGLNLATREGKAWKESAGDLPIISLEDAANLEGMANAIIENPHAMALLGACPSRETPIKATMRGVDCKALLDAHGSGDEQWVIADLKTTDDATNDAFARMVANYDYDMQAVFYADILAAFHGLETRPLFYWIAIEKTAPYTCRVYDSSDWLVSGEAKVEKALELYKECQQSGKWPHPKDDGINLLIRPAWA